MPNREIYPVARYRWINARVDLNEFRKIEKHAARLGLSLSDLIRSAIREKLDRERQDAAGDALEPGCA